MAQQIVTHNRAKKNASAYEKRKAKARFRRRAAIEPRISHLKSDFRLGRNFLKGQVSDAIDLLLAAAASNLNLWMIQVLYALVSAIQNWARECRTSQDELRANVGEGFVVHAAVFKSESTPTVVHC